MPVHVADDPLTCVARGTGIVLQELDKMDACSSPTRMRGRRADGRAERAGLRADGPARERADGGRS